MNPNPNQEVIDMAMPGSSSSSSGNQSPETKVAEFEQGGLTWVDNNSTEFDRVTNLVQNGFGPLSQTLQFIAVYKNPYLFPPTNDLIFESVCVRVHDLRGGDASVETAFLGGSKREMLDIMKQGFPSNNLGPLVLYRAAFASDCMTEEDGSLYLLVCRVVIGRRWTYDPIDYIHTGLPIAPHMADADCGVAPRSFAFFGALKHYYILPEYIVVSRSPQFQGLLAHMRTISHWRRPARAVAGFADYIAANDPQAAANIRQALTRFGNGTITRQQLVGVITNSPHFPFYHQYFVALLLKSTPMSSELIELLRSLVNLN